MCLSLFSFSLSCASHYRPFSFDTRPSMTRLSASLSHYLFVSNFPRFLSYPRRHFNLEAFTFATVIRAIRKDMALVIGEGIKVCHYRLYTDQPRFSQDTISPFTPIHPLLTPERYMADIKLGPQQAGDHLSQGSLLFPFPFHTCKITCLGSVQTP